MENGRAVIRGPFFFIAQIDGLVSPFDLEGESAQSQELSLTKGNEDFLLCLMTRWMDFQVSLGTNEHAIVSKFHVDGIVVIGKYVTQYRVTGETGEVCPTEAMDFVLVVRKANAPPAPLIATSDVNASVWNLQKCHCETYFLQGKLL